MNHKIIVSLKLLEQSADCLRFKLTFRNNSEVNLFFPYPEIVGLQFVNKANMQVAEWYTCLLVSTSWAGFTLQSGSKESLQYRVRPSTIELSNDDDLTDYSRWCLKLPASEYLVWFQFEVGEDYFCRDSHFRYNDLLREAESERAVVWTGEVKSNRLHIAHNITSRLT